MAVYWTPGNEELLRRCYYRDVARSSDSTLSNILSGRWTDVMTFVNLCNRQACFQAVLFAEETGESPLGLATIVDTNFTRKSARLLYSRYEDSVLFWDSLQLALGDAFQLVPLRHLYVELPLSSTDSVMFEAMGACLDLRLRSHIYMWGSYQDLCIWRLKSGEPRDRGA
jgi:hypothetical protein